MTPISLLYLLAGLVTMFWPIATMITKRKVLNAQWLMVAALFVFGLCNVVYSTLFNNFLNGEYLLVVLFMVLIMATQPMVYIAVVSLTNTKGITRGVRILFIPTVLVVILLLVSLLIGGSDMYHLWVERGVNGHAADFYPNSDKYNLIVLTHFYLFRYALIGEILFLAIYSYFKIRNYNRKLNEYFPSDHYYHDKHNIIYVEIIAVCVVTLLNQIFYPFNVERPLWVVALTNIIYMFTSLSIGHYTYTLSFSAEKLAEKLDKTKKRSHESAQNLTSQLAEYVEKEKHYLDANLSVFSLAERFNISEDEVVDAVHHRYGTNFGDYIDGIRVEHACQLMIKSHNYDFDDFDTMATLAHACGYSTEYYFEQAFGKVMQISVKEWYSGGVQRKIPTRP